MAAGKMCMLLLFLAFALLAPTTDARKVIFNRPNKRRWLDVIVVRPAPCPAGQQIDMLGLCRPVVGRGGVSAPLPPALFFSEYSHLYRDYDPHVPRDRPTRGWHGWTST